MASELNPIQQDAVGSVVSDTTSDEMLLKEMIQLFSTTTSSEGTDLLRLALPHITHAEWATVDAAKCTKLLRAREHAAQWSQLLQLYAPTLEWVRSATEMIASVASLSELVSDEAADGGAGVSPSANGGHSSLCALLLDASRDCKAPPLDRCPSWFSAVNVCLEVPTLLQLLHTRAKKTTEY